MIVETERTSTKNSFYGHYSLLEEARESWDQIVSEEIVYGAEVCDPNLDGAGPGAVDWLSKYDLQSIWFALDGESVGQGNGNFKAIIEIASGSAGTALDLKAERRAVDGHDHMLIDNAQFIDNEKGIVLERRASIVRLKRFDNGDCGGKNVPNGIPGNATECLGWNGGRFENREGRLRPWPVDIQEGKLPGELIQAGPEIVREFSDQHPDFFPHGFNLRAYDVPKFFNVILGRDGIRIIVDKLLDFGVKSIKVDLCPIGLHLYEIEATSPVDTRHS